MRRRLALLVAAALLSACTPWYRENAVRGLGTRPYRPAVDKAEAAMAAKDPARAERHYLDAIEIEPNAGSEVYIGLSRALAAQGRIASARAAADWAHARGASGAHGALASELVMRGLDPVALDVLNPSNPAAIAAQPSLSAYRGLAQAHALAASGRGREALEEYGKWVAAYGEPDHALLRRWAGEIRVHGAKPAEAVLAAARADVAAGNPTRALHEWAIAARYAPEDFARRTREEFGRVAREHLGGDVPPGAAVEAERAAKARAAGDRGAALAGWRKAVAIAPYWADARKELALAIDAVGLSSESAAQREWYVVLAPEAPDAAAIRAWKPAPRPAPRPVSVLASSPLPITLGGAAGIAQRTLSLGGSGGAGSEGAFVGAGPELWIEAGAGRRFGGRLDARWATFDLVEVETGYETGGDALTVGGGSSLIARLLGEYRHPLTQAGLAGPVARVLAGPRFEQHDRADPENAAGPMNLFPSYTRAGADVLIGATWPIAGFELRAAAGATPVSTVQQSPADALGRSPRSAPALLGDASASWRRGHWSVGAGLSYESRSVSFRGTAAAPLSPPLRNAELRETDTRFFLQVSRAL